VSRRCGVPMRSNTGRPWTNRHTIGTQASHTGAPNAANVPAEGGGTTTPTLGGGIWFSREQLPAAGEVAR
jgi:hypothetical protein